MGALENLRNFGRAVVREIVNSQRAAPVADPQATPGPTTTVASHAPTPEPAGAFKPNHQQPPPAGTPELRAAPAPAPAPAAAPYVASGDFFHPTALKPGERTQGSMVGAVGSDRPGESPAADAVAMAEQALGVQLPEARTAGRRSGGAPPAVVAAAAAPPAAPVVAAAPTTEAPKGSAALPLKTPAPAKVGAASEPAPARRPVGAPASPAGEALPLRTDGSFTPLAQSGLGVLRTQLQQRSAEDSRLEQFKDGLAQLLRTGAYKGEEPSATQAAIDAGLKRTFADYHPDTLKGDRGQWSPVSQQLILNAQRNLGGETARSLQYLDNPAQYIDAATGLITPEGERAVAAYNAQQDFEARRKEGALDLQRDKNAATTYQFHGRLGTPTRVTDAGALAEAQATYDKKFGPGVVSPQQALEAQQKESAAERSMKVSEGALNRAADQLGIDKNNAAKMAQLHATLLSNLYEGEQGRASAERIASGVQAGENTREQSRRQGALDLADKQGAEARKTQEANRAHELRLAAIKQVAEKSGATGAQLEAHRSKTEEALSKAVDATEQESQLTSLYNAATIGNNAEAQYTLTVLSAPGSAYRAQLAKIHNARKAPAVAAR